MITMGIDGSTTCTGWCVFDKEKLISYGAIPCDKNEKDWRKRINFMFTELYKIMKKEKVEKVFVEVPIRTLQNVNTLETLFCLHGSIMGLCVALDIEFVPVEVSAWRKQLGLLKGIKKGDDKKAILKERSVKMANELFGLNLIYKSPSSKFNEDDKSDSLLIAYSQLHPEINNDKMCSKKSKEPK